MGRADSPDSKEAATKEVVENESHSADTTGYGRCALTKGRGKRVASHGSDKGNAEYEWSEKRRGDMDDEWRLTVLRGSSPLTVDPLPNEEGEGQGQRADQEHESGARDAVREVAVAGKDYASQCCGEHRCGDTDATMRLGSPFYLLAERREVSSITCLPAMQHSTLHTLATL